MSAKYECEYCGYEMDREEAESAIDCGCPSCRHSFDLDFYKCETCGDTIEADGYHCDSCLMDQADDDRMHEALEGKCF